MLHQIEGAREMIVLLATLFGEFFLVGLLSFGGGLATIPFLQNIAVRRAWFTLTELADMIAVAESTPGPIGINMASYAGFRAGGIPGVAAATLGIVTPSIIVILIIARALTKFRENELVSGAFSALRPASCALIAAVGVGLIRASLFTPAFDLKAAILLLVLIPATLKIKAHPLVFIAVAAAVGVVLKM
ncbi:MAG: chromate transporter [Oscillospiraceae bacterium]|jgi:chromate transporter|nr:chromate transporter [Oscillospiraceae bacterium]